MKRVRVHLPRQGPVTPEDFVAFSRGERVQFCDAFIDGGQAPLAARLFLPQPAQPPFTVDELPVTETALPVLVRDSEPSVVALAPSSDAGRSAEIAAAVAVMRASWAWDERAELPVTVNGATFNSALPGQADQLSDQQVADVLTYVFNAWGNSGDAFSPDQVKVIRTEGNASKR